MRDILIACSTQAEAERGLRLAGDLSVACGARVSVLAAASVPVAMAAAGGLDAAAHLSDVLFSRDPHGYAPRFATQRLSWLDELRARVYDCGESDQLSLDVEARRPGLVIACNRDIARDLVAHTAVPVWHLKLHEREWFAARRIRCAIRGVRALEWAGRFASSLNADLEAAPARFFSAAADLVVVDREERSAWQPVRPLVVV